MPCLVLLCPLLWIHISAVHLNSIDHKGTRWQKIQWIAVKRNRLWFWVFPLNNHRHREREVKQSSNCQPRQWSEKRGSERERQRERGVYKQTPCNKFVFSRCQVPRPSLRLSVRSILFSLACAGAAAINFTECYEPLIRLANGACNLAQAKPTVVWIADTLLQRLKETALTIEVSVCGRAFDYAFRYVVYLHVCVYFFSLEDPKASWQLLIFHQKQDWGFHLAHPSFLCLSQTRWKWNGLFYGERLAQNR